jgi:hypothetical protein
MVQGAYFPQVKLPKRETDNSSLAEVKNIGATPPFSYASP